MRHLVARAAHQLVERAAERGVGHQVVEALPDQLAPAASVEHLHAGTCWWTTMR
jgi:hypothetical protein